MREFRSMRLSPHFLGAFAPWRESWLVAAEVLCIFCVFSLHGGWPAPDVNEAHYLCKAKHYWQPDWLKGDAFLESADAHLVFYWTFGWTTRFLSLPAAAWTGRILTWVLLAWSWRRLSFALLPRPWWSVLSSAIFVVLSSYGELAGEWVVGGVEAKGFAFALAFLALERVVRGQWNAAIVLCGAATAFHVLVGGWLLIAVLAARVFLLVRAGQKREEPPLAPPEYRGGVAPTRATLLGLLPFVVLALVLALPGLISALLLNGGVDADTVREASVIQVVRRLGHHLDPRQFPAGNVICHLALVGCWMATWIVVRRAPEWRRLGVVVWGAVALAAIGAGLGLALWLDWMPYLCTTLLRYYWFRTSDFLVPLAVALAATTGLAAWRQTDSPLASLALTLVLLFATAHIGSLLLRRGESLGPRGEKFQTTAEFRDWHSICQAAKDITPPDAVFLTPTMRAGGTFHWYAQRREVVNWKNAPQDAASIVAWWRRWKEIDAKDQPKNFAAREPAELRRLAIQYGATHLIAERRPPPPTGASAETRREAPEEYPPLPFRFLAQNNTYVMYKFTISATHDPPANDDPQPPQRQPAAK